MTFIDDSSDSDTDTFDDDSQSMTSTIANDDRESNIIDWVNRNFKIYGYSYMAMCNLNKSKKNPSQNR